MKNAEELARYLANGGLFAALYSVGRPRLEILAAGMQWHDPAESAKAGEAVPAGHVALAAKLAWPFLVKTGWLSADVASDEYKLAAALAILLGPMVPAMWKAATYRDGPAPEPSPPVPPAASGRFPLRVLGDEENPQAPEAAKAA